MVPQQRGWRKVAQGERGSGGRGYQTREGIGDVKSELTSPASKPQNGSGGLWGGGKTRVDEELRENWF